MIDYIIIVNDNGEFKTITSDEIDRHRVFLAENALTDAINYIIDERESVRNITTEFVNLPADLPSGEYDAVVTRAYVNVCGDVYVRMKLNDKQARE